MSCLLSPSPALPGALGPLLPQETLLPVPLNPGGTPDLRTPPPAPPAAPGVLQVRISWAFSTHLWSTWGLGTRALLRLSALSILPELCFPIQQWRLNHQMTANGDSTPVTLPFLGGVHTDLSVCAGPGTPHCTFLHRRNRSPGNKSWNRSLASSRMDSVRNTQGMSPGKRIWHLPSSSWRVDLNPKPAPKAVWFHIPAPLQVPSKVICFAQGPAAPAPCTSVTPTQTQKFQTEKV